LPNPLVRRTPYKFRPTKHLALLFEQIQTGQSGLLFFTSPTHTPSAPAPAPAPAPASVRLAPADARSQGHKSSIPTSSMAGLAFPSPRPSLSPYTGTSSPRLITKPDPAFALLLLFPETLKTRLPSGRGAMMESGGFAGGRGDLHTVRLSEIVLSRSDAPMRMTHRHVSSCIRYGSVCEQKRCIYANDLWLCLLKLRIVLSPLPSPLYTSLSRGHRNSDTNFHSHSPSTPQG
jgi:hypothetical protein